MFIVMHCMGMPFNGKTVSERSLGGSETAAYYVAKELAKQGHRVSVFTNSQEEGIFDGVRYLYTGAPSEQCPLGELFHYYAENTPHDVLIIQRHPHAFRFSWQAKVKLWWLHDLALPVMKDEVVNQLWNITGILTVSEMHKKQVVDTWGVNPEAVYPIQNGVDLSLFTTPEGYGLPGLDEGKSNLLYSSRPERGLEWLVMPDGIMEKLGDTHHLYVCHYDNTTDQMRPYYEQLWSRCNELPNVTLLGSLTKQELADAMRQCDALVYPTPGPLQPDFKEVSCITAMEAMAAGLPFISSKVGALPETCRDSGSVLIPLKEDGLPDVDAFVRHLSSPAPEAVQEKQLKAAKRYSWSVAAGMIEDIIEQAMEAKSPGAVAREMLRNSDIYPLEDYLTSFEGPGTSILSNVGKELDTCYRFAFTGNWKNHYDGYYEYEKERGVEYGPEDLAGNPRFEYVASLVSGLDPGSVVLDYGCAHGHYMVNLAKRFPDLRFIGVDITRSNIDKAEQWASELELNNVQFICGSIEDEHPLEFCQQEADCIIAAEVIEHVGNPKKYVDILLNYLKPKGRMIITTPYGPWEAQGYEEHFPWRAHVWHFDRADLYELWGHFPGYSVTTIPAGNSKWGSVVGSYVTVFNRGSGISTGEIDYSRKLKQVVPLQTVSLCMIVKDAEATIKRCLDSVADVVDEICISVDETTTDRTVEVIERWKADRKGLWPTVLLNTVESPLKIGFDEARNESISKASGDWILWMDADEILVHAHNLFKYLQNNAFNGYAIRQHHFAVEPLGVMKTDLPCRLFRNNIGVKFFGVVHEHPEKELNRGVGHALLIPDVEIAHEGYTTEAIRRKRFDRNIHLMGRDRQKYPERYLGKFLWMRDCAQMIRYNLSEKGFNLTHPENIELAEEGVRMFEQLLNDKQLRMLADGIEWYSICATVLGAKIRAAFSLSIGSSDSSLEEPQKTIEAAFLKRSHINKLFDSLLDEKVKDYEER